jgi:hypothetical protein
MAGKVKAEKPGWLRREFEATAAEIKRWPKSMRDCTALAHYITPAPKPRRKK